MKPARILLTGALLFAPIAVWAKEPIQIPAIYTYEMFEASVPHTDLETCPNTEYGDDKFFCRLTMANEGMHVYIFALDGEQPLIGITSHYEQDFSLTFE